MSNDLDSAVPLHLRKQPYVSINFMRDTETDGYWLVLFFPDETVLRLRMTEREAAELKLAVASGSGSVKVKVGV